MGAGAGAMTQAQAPAASTAVRLGVIAIVVVALFGALFARLWFLQVLAAPEFEIEAERNQIELISLPTVRGRIFDRNGVVLAENVDTGIVTVDRAHLGDEADRGRVLGVLSELLGVSSRDLAERLDDSRNHPLLPVVVAHGIAESVLLLIEERNYELPGVETALIKERIYPLGEHAAHIVGYLGEIDERTLNERRREGYTLGDDIGQTGIEFFFERELRGAEGRKKLEVDSRRNVLGELGVSLAPEPGNDIYLTIDIDLQMKVEELVVEALATARGRRNTDTTLFHPAHSGVAVVLDVRDGSVLAMASYPSYDPNVFIEGFSNDRFVELFADPLVPAPLNNRAIQGQYAPGSVFKLVTALAGLETGVITPRGPYFDQGFHEVGNCEFQCIFRNANDCTVRNHRPGVGHPLLERRVLLPNR